MAPELKEETAANSSMDLSSIKDALNDVAKEDDKIVYTEDELETMREVKKRLVEEDELKFVNPRFLAYTVIASKGRVEDATEKYRKFLKSMEPFEFDTVESDEDLWTKDFEETEKFLRTRYAPCGVDNGGRQIMWIRGGQNPIMPHEERPMVRAGILYVIAIHGDVKSLREGITFVIDTSRPAKKIGNEAKLQKHNQSFPLRPQAIYLAGASATMRLVINGLIRVASFFTKQKILDRIKFVSLKEAVESVPKESAPKYLDGGGGGIEDIVAWTRQRYENLPVPEL